MANAITAAKRRLFDIRVEDRTKEIWGFVERYEHIHKNRDPHVVREQDKRK